jgi:predicted RecA/RadA family phage recombinase
MAKNKVFEDGRQLQHPVASGVVSGDPVAVGQITGVALADRDADGNAVLDHQGVYLLSVGGVDQVGNSAVAYGDRLYYTNADTPKINKKNTGIPFGFAMGTVSSGGTGSINVRLATF